MTMKNAKRLLEMCRKRFVTTRPNTSHSLTLNGNVLVLTLMMGDTFQSFNFDDDDLKLSPTKLVEEIARLYKQPDPIKPPPNVA